MHDFKYTIDSYAIIRIMKIILNGHFSKRNYPTRLQQNANLFLTDKPSD